MAIPLMAIQAAAAAAQAIAGAVQAAKGKRELETEIRNLPKYQMSPGIVDYYNQALQRYGVSPTQTALYKRQMQNIQRAAATGLAGAQGSRARMGAASSIFRGISDASLEAERAAEQEKAQRFGVLGQAAQLKRGEEAAAFQQNLVAPSQLRMQMASQKAAGGAQLFNVGLSNLFGAAQSAATQDLYKNIYGLGGTTQKVGSGATQKISGGNVTPASLGSMGRTAVGFGSPSTIVGLRTSATPSLTRGISMMPTPPNIPYLPKSSQLLNPVNYPF